MYVRIDGIYCEHCVETITLALNQLAGVDSVFLRQNVAHLSGEQLPSPEVIVETVRVLGYETDEGKISSDKKRSFARCAGMSFY